MTLRTALLAGLLAATASTSPAQFQIKGAPELTPLPQPDPVAQPAEEPPENAVQVYSGEHIILPLTCERERLEYAGLLCTDSRPCDLSVDWTAVASSGEIVVLAGEIYNARGALESVVLVSADEGQSWTESAERVPAAGMTQVQFTDAEHGWVGGQQGDVATGQKPFLLATADGGKSWKRRLLLSGEESRHGVVLEFRFDSPDHGFVVLEKIAAAGDPYELHETHNGGRSWNTRQIVSERPVIPGGRFRNVREEAWRIVEGPHGEDWLIEHRSDAEPDGWAQRASFAANLGRCPAPVGGELSQQ